MVRQIVSLCGGEALEPQLQPIAGPAVAAPQGGYPAIGSGERFPRRVARDQESLGWRQRGEDSHGMLIKTFLRWPL
jgi:hypothetical protein